MNVSFRLAAAASALAVTVVSAHAFSFSYTWTGAEPTMANRIFRDGNPSVYGTPKSFPGTLAGPVFYTTWLISNPYGTISDLEVTTSTNETSSNTFLAAYAVSFDPNNLATNYLGDTGSSPLQGLPQSMGIQIAPNTDILLMAGSLNTTGNVGTSFNVEGSLTPVPEPASMLAIGAGLAGLAARKRRKNR